MRVGKKTPAAAPAATPPLPQSLDKRGVAKLLNCHVRTVEQYVQTGELPAPARVGAKWIWLTADLLRFLKGRRQEVSRAK
jgi:excisionase family DNA binding protein